jgi:uncharacterized OB-fold protein
MPDKPPVVMMEEFISLDYTTLATDVGIRFSEMLMQGKIIGHRSKSTGLVYVPPKGYDPISGQPTGADDEVVVSDRGTVTGFTIIDPIQYFGQKETERYVQASVLLDGASSALGGVRIGGIPVEQVRSGMRVRAVWKPPGEREGTVVDNWGGRAVASCVAWWEPTGEPDVPAEKIRDSFW